MVITHIWVVSNNRGTPKWMIYNGKPYFLMDDLGGKPTIFGNIHISHLFNPYISHINGDRINGSFFTYLKDG